ncbi:MAG: substrate-binding domain-containing protein, partial [Phycisphaerae bacterium]
LVRSGGGRLSEDFTFGVASAAEASGYGLKIIQLDERKIPIQRVRQVVAGSDGVVLGLCTEHLLQDGLGEILGDKHLSLCDSEHRDTADCFEFDYRESGRLLATHLIRGEHEKVVYLQRATHTSSTTLLREGFTDACNQASVSVDVFDFPAAGDQMETIVGHADVIAASDDHLAVQAMLWAAFYGRRAGIDYVVGGQGNATITTNLSPSLTTTDLDGHTLGERVGTTLIQRIEKSRMDAFLDEKVTPRLIVRESSQMKSASPSKP